MKEIIAYKVLSRVNDKLYSAIVPLEDGGIIYKQRTKNYPKIKVSRLLAFDSFDAAENFISSSESSYKEIWRVKVTKSKKNSYPLPLNAVSISSILRVWTKTVFLNFSWPKGTIIVNYIKLIKKVFP